MATVLTLVAARYYIFLSVNQRFTEKCGFDSLSTCSQNSFFCKSFPKLVSIFFLVSHEPFSFSCNFLTKSAQKWFLLKHYTSRSIFSFILNQKLNVKVSSTLINVFNRVENVLSQVFERFTIFSNKLFIILVILVEFYTQNLPGCLLEILVA